MRTTRVCEKKQGSILIKVTDTKGVRTLWLNGVPQSQLLLDAPHQLITDYEEVMASWSLFLSDEQLTTGRGLALGLGGGSAIRHICHYFPNLQVTAVENSDAIASVAYEYFDLPKTPNLTVVIDDAFSLVSNHHLLEHKSNDLLLIDLFDPKLQATYQFKKSFWEDCVRLLSANGVLAVNLWATNTSIFEEVLKQIGETFDWRILLLPVEGFNNVILFAFHPDGSNYSLAELQIRAKTLSEHMQLPLQHYLEALIKQNHLQLARCVENLEKSTSSAEFA